MAQGRDLTASQVRAAIEYNHARHSSAFVRSIRTALGMGGAGPFDEAFVRFVADWQEANVGAGLGDGRIGPRTEGHLNIPHPKAVAAAANALLIQTAGFTLFDSWGNDLRDNNNDGVVDDAHEVSSDGAHFARRYTEFGTVAGMYSTGGWDFLPHRDVFVANTRTVRGSFRYRVCADVVSEAYHAAGAMPAQRSTLGIYGQFQHKGFVWQRSQAYPSMYLPGDFICTLDVHAGEGHSGIVVQAGPTRGGAEVPIVVQLPGPSTQISDGTYNPESTNDITRGPWSRWRIDSIQREFQYLGRFLHSRLAL